MTAGESKITPENLQAWLTQKFLEWAEIEADEFESSQPFTKYGLDSFGAMTFSTELEDELGFEINARLLWDNPNMDTLAAALAEEVKKHRSA